MAKPLYATRESTAGLPGWVWTSRDLKTACLCGVLIGISVVFLIGTFKADGRSAKSFLFGDFFALWSYAKIAFSHPAAELYDMAKLHGSQVALGMLPKEQNPFPYPPTFLLIIWPLGFLPLYVAYAVWAGTTLLLYLLAVCTRARCKILVALATLLAPASTACLVSGQSGFLLAALLIGGLRLIPRRPVLAGILFGLLTYKPQFGILLPVALVAAGQWRCIAAACATTAGLVLVTMMSFGASIWGTWWQALPDYAAWFDRVTVTSQFMPTVLTNLQILGVPQGLARTAQIAATLVAATVVWRAWRRLPRLLAVPALLAATCLATPHAFIYDLPMLSSAVFMFAAHRLQSTGSLVLPEIAVLVVVLIFPEIMALNGVQAPISTIAISFFLVLILTTESATARFKAGLTHAVRVPDSLRIF